MGFFKCVTFWCFGRTWGIMNIQKHIIQVFAECLQIWEIYALCFAYILVREGNFASSLEMTQDVSICDELKDGLLREVGCSEVSFAE